MLSITKKDLILLNYVISKKCFGITSFFDIMILEEMMIMKYNIRGDKMLVTDAIREYAQEKLGRLDKYFKDSDSVTANVVLKVRGREQIVEVTIPTTSFILRGEEGKADLYASIDKVTDKLERQIRKNKTKLKNQNMATVHKEFNFDYEDKEMEEDTSKIVKTKTLEVKPMDAEEAILQMNLLGHEFFVYKDKDTLNANIIYKRKDGNYGLIETK